MTILCVSNVQHSLIFTVICAFKVHFEPTEFNQNETALDIDSAENSENDTASDFERTEDSQNATAADIDSAEDIVKM